MGDRSYSVKRSLAKQSLFIKKRPLLSHLDIELTERCNNACIHCYINLPARDEKAARRELTTQQWQEILSQAAQLGAISVRFTGGEPLLRADFDEIYLFARHLGMQVMLFTNARLITPVLADLLARVPPLKKIEVSVYGMHPETYDVVACVRGAYTEFRQGVSLLSERHIPFLLKPVLLSQNMADLPEFEAWAATIPWMDDRPTSPLFLDFRTRRDSVTRNRSIDRLRISPEDGVKMLACHAGTYRKSMAQFCANFIGAQGDRLFSCPAGEAGCVDAYGNYQMCMLLRHPDTLYDLKQGTLREALTRVFPRFRKISAANPDYLKRCGHCFLKGLCEQCPAKSWTEHGSLDTPVEYLCEVAHAQARYLGLLMAGEHSWQIPRETSQARIERLVAAES